jgi:predicted RNase H-like HicB family nuclease
MKPRRPDPEPEEIIVSVDVVLTLTFWRDEEQGGVWAECRDLPRLAAFGKNLGEARSNARTEIKLALQDLAEDGEPVPPLTYSPPWRRSARWSGSESRTKRRIKLLKASLGLE